MTTISTCRAFRISVEEYQKLANTRFFVKAVFPPEELICVTASAAVDRTERRMRGESRERAPRRGAQGAAHVDEDPTPPHAEACSVTIAVLMTPPRRGWVV